MSIVTFVSPTRGGDFMAGVIDDPDVQDDGEILLGKSLPPLWAGKHQGHFIQLDQIIGLGEDTRLNDLEISHLALLESFEYGLGDAIKFGGEEVTHNAMMVWFSDKRQKYYAIHCRDCARKLITWMLENQHTWQAVRTAGRA